VIVGFLGAAVLVTAARAEDVRWATTVAGEREGAATAGRLQAVRELEEKGQWSEAVEEYLAILAGPADELVPVDGRYFVTARRRCHERLALLPDSALALYRQRVDTQAKKWCDAGAAERDTRLLRRVVDEAFCSRPGERALDLLGELAFEEGRMDEAERWWRLLAVPASVARNRSPAETGVVIGLSGAAKGIDADGRTDFQSVPPGLVYPLASSGDAAKYRAKQLLARLFRGDPTFAAEFNAFRALHPKAEGHLAGRNGNYGEILQAVSEQRDLKSAPRPAESWPTFAGDPTRNRFLPPPPDRNWLSRLCEDEPVRFDLLKHQRIEANGTAPPAEKPKGATAPKVATASEVVRSLAYYPVIFDHKVAVADADGVTVYDPLTGKVQDWSISRGALEEGHRETKPPAPPDVRFTLTVSGRFLYARLGAPVLDPTKKQDQQESRLVSLEWVDGEHLLKQRWSVRASAFDKEQTVFEGSPLVDGNRAYCAFTRLEDRATTGLACFDASTGAVRWRQEICETSAIDPKQPRYWRPLVTLAGQQVVYGTQTGVIAALDAENGSRVWAVRYPTRGLTNAAGDPSPRDLSPCLYDGGRVYVAPADYDRLCCLDSATGRTIWERDKIEVIHLLGVADGRLILNSRDCGPANRGERIRALDAATGLDEWSAASHDEPWVAGRGLIMGDLVFCPKNDVASSGRGAAKASGIRVVNLRDGSAANDRLNLPNGRLAGVYGHLAYADGLLVVTDRTRMTVFVAPALRREERKREAKERPQSVLAHYSLAQAETDAGAVGAALAEWERVQQSASPQLRVRGRPVGFLAQQQRHDLMLHAGEQARDQYHWDEAAESFHRAAAKEFVVSQRLRGLAGEATNWECAGRPERAAEVWQSILRDEALRKGMIEDRAGNPQVAGIYAAARVGPAAPSARCRLSAPTATIEPSFPWRRVGQTLLGRNEVPITEEEACAGTRAPDLFFADGRSLVCRAADSGDARWRAALSWSPSWVGRHEDQVLSAGAAGIVALTVADGAPLWAYPAPHAAEGEGELGAFHLSDGRLFFIQGGNRLFALDAQAGLVLWNRWAPDARLGLPEPAGRFFPIYRAEGGRVVVQTSGGKWWLLDAASGRLIHAGDTTREPWAQAPLVLDKRSWCLAADVGRVILFDPETGREHWTYEIPGHTTSRGVVPRLLSNGEVLGAVLYRNFGCMLQRLDPRDGRPLWDKECLLDGELGEYGGIAVSRDAFYVAEGGVLVAHASEDGRRLWERPLESVGENPRVALCGGRLIVYPSEGRAVEIRLRGPFGRLECNLAAYTEEGRDYPVFFVDAKSGQFDQRLNFSVPATRFWVRIDRNSAGLEASVRSVSPPSPTRVCFDCASATVVLPGRLWHLTARK
jgi:outer membrane protein assembly factor BamB